MGSGVATWAYVTTLSASASPRSQSSRGPAIPPRVIKAAAADTIVLPYNDIDAVQRRPSVRSRVDRRRNHLPEASPGNMGVVPPGPAFSAALCAITAEHGALLILDE